MAELVEKSYIEEGGFTPVRKSTAVAERDEPPENSKYVCYKGCVGEGYTA